MTIFELRELIESSVSVWVLVALFGIWLLAMIAMMFSTGSDTGPR